MIISNKWLVELNVTLRRLNPKVAKSSKVAIDIWSLKLVPVELLNKLL